MKIKIEKELIKVIKDVFNIELDEVSIQVPKDSANGDFTTNIAMVLKGQLNKNPRDIANEIISELSIAEIEKVEIAGPGFINIFINNNSIFMSLNQMLNENDIYGSSKLKGKYNVEYISANPTGWLHIGHARNAAYGASLVNIMRFAGYDVEAEYYINDAGSQMNLLAQSVFARYKELHGQEVVIEDDFYKGQDIILCAEALKEKHGDKYLSIDLEKDNSILEFAYGHMLTTLKQHLNELGVNTDIWYSERNIYKENLFQPAFEKLEKNGYIKVEDGATWCLTTKIKDDKDRVLIKNDGEKTYFASDIAYHLVKLNRGYDSLINVWGADHHGYIDRVQSALTALGARKGILEVELMQMVKIEKNGEEVKMSKRMGTAITIKELIDEIGKDALRYYLVSRTQNTQLTIDVEVAKKTNSENPLYYVQYAHARCNQLITKSGIEIDNNVKFDLLKNDIEGDIVKHAAKFKDVVEAAAINREPHRVTNFAYDLAALVHKYYGNVKIIDENNLELTKQRVIMFAGIKHVLKNALTLVGVDAPEQM